jgi:hypothetical protein
MALSDVAIRQAKPGPKPFKMVDGEGLHLLIMPTGGKLWRSNYRLVGRMMQLAIGADLPDTRQRTKAPRQRLAIVAHARK